MATTKRTLSCWKEFNLSSVQKNLDSTAAGIVTKQDGSDLSRKSLIDKTREFRQTASEDARKQVTPLIKALQSEVDALTKRSKYAENAFLSIYKQILEVPDPVPFLEHTQVLQQQLTKAKNFEMENQKLRQTLEEYHIEFAEVKNQEVTINKLKEKLKEYDESSGDRLDIMLKEKEKNLLAEFTKKEMIFDECQMSLTLKLGEAEQRSKMLQKALDSTNSELFDVKAKSEEESSARNAELDIVSVDLEKATQRLMLAEKHVETLNEQLQDEKARNSNSESIENTYQPYRPDEDVEIQLAAKERELSQLVQELHFLQNSLNKVKENSQKEVGFLEKKLNKQKEEIWRMEGIIESQKEFDEIKRELSILKHVEFSQLCDSNGEDSLNKPLERLLLEKSRVLQSENASLKVAQHALTVQVPDLQLQCRESEKRLCDQADLISKLESDLLNVNGLPLYYRGEGEGEANPETTAVEKAVSGLTETEKATMSQVDTDSLLPIITSQRERFKAKNVILENQTLNQQQEITILRHELETVRTDNVKLYEKIKFLQSYSQEQDTSSRNDDDSVQRYGTHYEQKMDPFSAFSKREKQKRYASLSAPERATLNMGRFILSNKVARTIVFFYTIFLHCLVFLVLYKMAYTESCKRDMASDCAKRFAAHMSHVHNH